MGGIRIEQCLPFVAYLSSSEQDRFQRIMRDQRKLQFLVGRMLLRHSVVQLSGYPIEAISVTERDRQAPLLEIVGFEATPFFSISHTGDWVACAISADVAIGLDIEQYNAKRDLEAIARHTFGPDELSWFQQQPDQVSAFYRLWSIKEARFKLTQGYTILTNEHCYEVQYPDFTIVLMSAESLAVPPVCKTLDFKQIQITLLNGKPTRLPDVS